LAAAVMVDKAITQMDLLDLLLLFQVDLLLVEVEEIKIIQTLAEQAVMEALEVVAFTAQADLMVVLVEEVVVLDKELQL
jgi:hypothetical protein